MGGVFSGFEKVAEFAVKIFEFLLLLIDNLIDFVLGAITMIWAVAKQALNLLPLVLDIIQYLLTFIEYIIDLFLEYWRVPAAIMTLVPLYVMLFFLVNRINSILDD
jgi:hypothetical protein